MIEISLQSAHQFNEHWQGQIKKKRCRRVSMNSKLKLNFSAVGRLTLYSMTGQNSNNVCDMLSDVNNDLTLG